MNTANLDLCKELYELSGWDGAMFYYYLEDRRTIDADLVVGTVNEKFVGVYGTTVGCDECEGEYAPKVHPAYDLGYLLWKLPEPYDLRISGGGNLTVAELHYRNSNVAKDFKVITTRLAADTTENAVCKLVIELFKQGVLK